MVILTTNSQVLQQLQYSNLSNLAPIRVLGEIKQESQRSPNGEPWRSRRFTSCTTNSVKLSDWADIS